VRALVDAGKEQLTKTELAGIFDDGDPEVTMVWQEKNPAAWCRSRIDYLPTIVRQGGHVIVPDYKTTAGSAHPDDFARGHREGDATNRPGPEILDDQGGPVHQVDVAQVREQRRATEDHEPAVGHTLDEHHQQHRHTDRR